MKEQKKEWILEQYPDVVSSELDLLVRFVRASKDGFKWTNLCAGKPIPINGSEYDLSDLCKSLAIPIPQGIE